MIEKPAWLVRDTARGNFLNKIWRQIEAYESHFDNRLDLYRIMTLVLVRRLSPRGVMAMSSVYDLPSIPREKRRAVQEFLSKDISRQIVRFRHSAVEGVALDAEILGLAVGQLTHEYRTVFTDEQKKFVEELQGGLKLHERSFEDPLALYRVLIVMLVRRLSPRGLISMHSMYDLPLIPREKRMAVQEFFSGTIQAMLTNRAQSAAEHQALLAKLLEWSADQLIWPYRQALEKEEYEHPGRIPLTDKPTED